MCSRWPSRRRMAAAMIGCERLPVNMPSDRPIGMDIVAATASWVRKAKRTMSGQSRTGVSRKATKSRTFGGQSTAMLGSDGIIRLA